MNRCSAKCLPPELRVYDKWPNLEIDSLPPAKRDWYERMRAVIVGAIDGQPVTALCNEKHVSRCALSRALKRCLLIAHDGQIMGWRALLKGGPVVPYRRTARATPGKRGGGLAGALQQVLVDHPDIHTAIDDLALKRKSRTRVHETRAAESDIHQEFLRLCRRFGIKDSEYPFNTGGQGRRALQRYVAELRQSHFTQAAGILGGPPATRRARIGRGFQRHLVAGHPYDVGQCDAHRLDFIGTVRIPHPTGSRRIPIERLQLLVIIDEFSHAVPAFALAIKREANAQDALRAFQSTLRPWQRHESRYAGIAYPAGAAMPTEAFPELIGVAWNALKFDNASIFLSSAVAERLRRRTGAAINYGPVGDWTRRYLVEGFFSVLERRGFQRLPNTVGSDPKDPRRDNPERKAVNLEIDWQEMQDLLAVYIATYNATRQSELGDRSPLEVLGEHLHDPHSGFLPRRLPPLLPGTPDLDVEVEYPTVRGNIAEGRHPYVELEGVEYTNALLAEAGHLIGTRIVAHLPSDLRTVEGFLPGGGTLGVLFARGAWGRVPHDRDMRKAIKTLVRSGKLVCAPGEDIFQAYLRYKAENASRASKSNGARVSPDATELARSAQLTGLPIPEVDLEAPPIPQPPLPRPRPLPPLFAQPRHTIVRTSKKDK